MNFVNALNKPPVIKNSACSNHIELATQQWRNQRHQFVILSTFHCEFNGARSCSHAQKIIPLAPTHSFNSIFIVSTIIDLKLVDIHGMSFSQIPYKCPPSINNIFTRMLFFLFLSFIFIAHFFVGLRELA